MDRKEVRDKMMDMGFYASNKGFKYIVEALEAIDKEGIDEIKITVVEAEIAKRNGTTVSAVERAIRHAINRYYERSVMPPHIFTDGVTGTRLPLKEFLYRLYLMIYDKEC